MKPSRLISFVLLLASCGGDDEGAPTPQAGAGVPQAGTAAGSAAPQAGTAAPQAGTAAPQAGAAAAGTGGTAAPTPTEGIQTGTLIEIDDGMLRGAADRGARHFLGIPFAAPPTGDLRWAPPAPVPPWDGERDATAFGAACAQTSWAQGPGSNEEDCLFLNVWTPEPAPTEPLPVMVWLPGGGNQNGSAADLSPLTLGTAIYDGTDLATSSNVVVVTINYRLAAFGFFSHAALRDEGSPSGNQGLQDQQAALRWVQDNILAFGGDANNVTLFGESAGSQDTCLQVVSPGAAGLFHRAISQSGGCTTNKTTRDDAEANGAAFAEALGCGDAADPLACLRALPVADVLAAAGDFDPVVDGEVIPDQPRTLIDSGSFAKVPYLLGANFEEGILFLLTSTPVQDEEQYLARLEEQYGERGADVAAMYPVSDFPTPQAALIRVRTDASMVCATHDVARRVAAQGVPTYLYNFSRSIPGLEFLGPTHGVEMPYVFGTLVSPGEVDMALSERMQAYWGRFALTGDPNGDGAVEWPQLDEATKPVLTFDADDMLEPGFRRDECDFWTSFYETAT
jgi:para-nitrobenzyl esterase